MSATVYRLGADVTVAITVRDAEAIERVVGAEGDEWRSRFYNLSTRDDVLDHWTYNAIVNGVRDVTRLDGWNDLPAGAVEIHVEYEDMGTLSIEVEA